MFSSVCLPACVDDVFMILAVYYFSSACVYSLLELQKHLRRLCFPASFSSADWRLVYGCVAILGSLLHADPSPAEHAQIRGEVSMRVFM